MGQAGEGVARDRLGRGMVGRGHLVAWNERRAVLLGQQDAISNELAGLDSEGRCDLGCGFVARVQPDGSLLINAGQPMHPVAVVALRDHLCNVLGLPDRFGDVTTLSDEEARKLAVDLVAPFMRHDHEMVSAAGARRAIFSALDHVGVIRFDTTATPLATRQAGGGEANHESAKPQASAPAAGTAGSAQEPPLVRLGPGGDHTQDITGQDLVGAIATMRSIVDQFTALIYRLTNHGTASKPSSPSIDVQA